MTPEKVDDPSEPVISQILKSRRVLVDGKFYELAEVLQPKQTVSKYPPYRWVKEIVRLKPMEEDKKIL